MFDIETLAGLDPNSTVDRFLCGSMSQGYSGSFRSFRNSSTSWLFGDMSGICGFGLGQHWQLT
jgi:hypothetical protein